MNSCHVPVMPNTNDLEKIMEALCASSNITRVIKEKGERGAPQKANVTDLITVIKAFYEYMKTNTIMHHNKDQKIEELEDKIIVLVDEVNELKSKVEKSKIGPPPSPNKTNPKPSTSIDTQKVVKAVVADMNERKARENNLVIFGIPSSIERESCN